MYWCAGAAALSSKHGIRTQHYVSVCMLLAGLVQIPCLLPLLANNVNAADLTYCLLLPLLSSLPS
jgi:hypothetical protein